VVDLRATLCFITLNKKRVEFYYMNIFFGFQGHRNKNKAGFMIDKKKNMCCAELGFCKRKKKQ
jgi:hypothetical protein